MERGLLRSAAAMLQEINSVALESVSRLSSAPILKLWGSPLRQSFADAGCQFAVLEMADGETIKAAECGGETCRKMVRLGRTDDLS